MDVEDGPTSFFSEGKLPRQNSPTKAPDLTAKTPEHDRFDVGSARAANLSPQEKEDKLWEPVHVLPEEQRPKPKRFKRNPGGPGTSFAAVSLGAGGARAAVLDGGRVGHSRSGAAGRGRAAVRSARSAGRGPLSKGDPGAMRANRVLGAGRSKEAAVMQSAMREEAGSKVKEHEDIGDETHRLVKNWWDRADHYGGEKNVLDKHIFVRKEATCARSSC